MRITCDLDTSQVIEFVSFILKKFSIRTFTIQTTVYHNSQAMARIDSKKVTYRLEHIIIYALDLVIFVSISHTFRGKFAYLRF